MMQPEWINPAMCAAALEAAPRRKELPALAEVRFDGFQERLLFQIMHIGSYEAEGPTLATLHTEHMPAGGFTFNAPTTIERSPHSPRWRGSRPLSVRP